MARQSQKSKMSDLGQWAAWLGISGKEVRRLCEKGLIPGAFRMGPRGHWRAPFTPEAAQSVYARHVEQHGVPAANAKLLRPFRVASRPLDMLQRRFARRARPYRIAAAIDAAIRRDRITLKQLDSFEIVTRTWLADQNPEAAKQHCLESNPEYKQLFPCVETLNYAQQNPKQSELVAAIMLAVNVENAGETTARISQVRVQWSIVIGQKFAHGKGRYFEDDDGRFRPSLSNPDRATFYRRFNKFEMDRARLVARQLLEPEPAPGQGISNEIELLFDEEQSKAQSGKTPVRGPEW